MWVGASQRNCIVLEETTKAFISVGNNLLQSCLPSTGMNLKNLKKETVNWTNHNKAYNNNHHDTKTLSLWFIFATDTTTFFFYELMCLGIEMSFWIWSVSGNQRTKSNKSTQTSSPPHSDFPSPHNVVSGFPPLSSKTSHAFSISQSLVFCTLHHLFQIYYHSVSYLCTVCKKQGAQRWKDYYQRQTWCWNHLI